VTVIFMLVLGTISIADAVNHRPADGRRPPTGQDSPDRLVAGDTVSAGAGSAGTA
jgi:hypothetical protein